MIIEIRNELTNDELINKIRGILAEEFCRKEAQASLDKTNPNSFTVSEEVFKKSKLFDRSERIGQWY